MKKVVLFAVVAVCIIIALLFIQTEDFNKLSIFGKVTVMIMELVILAILTSPIWLYIIYRKRKNKQNKLIKQQREQIKQKEELKVEDIEEKPLSKSDINIIINQLAKKEINYEEVDPLFEEAARLIVTHQSGSTSLIQRKLNIGYNRAGILMDQLEYAGIVGSTQEYLPRDVCILNEYQLQKILNNGNKKYSKKQIDEVKNLYSDEIEKRRIQIQRNVRLREQEKQEERDELEKQQMKEELLEIERKKQLRRAIKKELIESGEIQREAKRTPIPQDIQDRVWVRDGGKCVICGSSENLEFDHIIPFSKGGANTYRNIQLLCEKCNREKSNKIG